MMVPMVDDDAVLLLVTVVAAALEGREGLFGAEVGAEPAIGLFAPLLVLLWLEDFEDGGGWLKVRVQRWKPK